MVDRRSTRAYSLSRMTNTPKAPATSNTNGRPKTRTAVLGAGLRDAFLDAFGTLWNAYRQLGLAICGPELAVSFPTFSRACRGLPIAPEELSAIVACWELRRRQPVAA
jgi:hypothetical protein